MIDYYWLCWFREVANVACERAVDAGCGEGAWPGDQEEVLRSCGAHWLCFVPHEIRGNYGAPVVGLTRFWPLRRVDKYVEDSARDQEAVGGRADAYS